MTADVPWLTPTNPILTIPAGATQATFFVRGIGLQSFDANVTGAVTIFIGDKTYKAITPNPDPYIYDGSLINLSTRSTLPPSNSQRISVPQQTNGTTKAISVLSFKCYSPPHPQ